MSRRTATIILTVLLLSVTVSAFQRELYVGDETKYSQVVREMRAGSFFLPTLNGTPFTHKPPLHFWLVDLLTYPFGVYSIWPFVLPSIAAFVLLLWLLNRMGGPMAAFVCGTSLMVWGSAQTARMDLTFTALLVLAAMLLERFLDQKDFRALLLCAVAVSVAALVKGPMAPVIIATLLLFEAIRRRGLPRGNYLPAIAALLLIPLLWVVPAVLVGGEAFWREIFYKQTVGRAVGAWVHKSPPWFYLMRAPLTLMPWFFLLVVALFSALRGGAPRARFYLSWLLAVLVPYSLLSSKLDVYMIALIPPAALLIATLLSEGDRFRMWGRRANLVMIVLFLLIGVAGLVVQPHHVKGPDSELLELLSVRGLFVVMAATSLNALIVTLRRSLVSSSIALGFIPVATFVYAGIVLLPLINSLASSAPLIAAIERQAVDPSGVSCHVCPHLWIRGMSPKLASVQLVDAQSIANTRPVVIVTRRRDAAQISSSLTGFKHVDEFRMIGKWFDVYRR